MIMSSVDYMQILSNWLFIWLHWNDRSWFALDLVLDLLYREIFFLELYNYKQLIFERMWALNFKFVLPKHIKITLLSVISYYKFAKSSIANHFCGRPEGLLFPEGWLRTEVTKHCFLTNSHFENNICFWISVAWETFLLLRHLSRSSICGR
jgi:hypothetical protein